jgi:hypothetical protein
VPDSNPYDMDLDGDVDSIDFLGFDYLVRHVLQPDRDEEADDGWDDDGEGNDDELDDEDGPEDDYEDSETGEDDVDSWQDEMLADL